MKPNIRVNRKKQRQAKHQLNQKHISNNNSNLFRNNKNDAQRKFIQPHLSRPCLLKSRLLANKATGKQKRTKPVNLAAITWTNTANTHIPRSLKHRRRRFAELVARTSTIHYYVKTLVTCWTWDSDWASELYNPLVLSCGSKFSSLVQFFFFSPCYY